MDEIKRAFKNQPVTVILILLNSIVFLITEFTGGSDNVAHMVECGAAYTPFIVDLHEYYRLFTSMFLHFGIQHLVNNMLVLFVLGQRLEPLIGKIKYIILYVVSGVGANILSLLFEIGAQDPAVSAGASGAVFAVMGAMIYVVARHKGKVKDLTIRQMAIMTAFSLYFGFTSNGVDNVAHIGGMIMGFILSLILYHPKKQ